MRRKSSASVRQALSSLLNGKAALTSEMGLRVKKAFGTKMEHLMRMQLAFDLAQARKMEDGVRVRRYVAKRDGIVRDGVEIKAPRRTHGVVLRPLRDQCRGNRRGDTHFP